MPKRNFALFRWLDRLTTNGDGLFPGWPNGGFEGCQKRRGYFPGGLTMGLKVTTNDGRPFSQFVLISSKDPHTRSPNCQLSPALTARLSALIFPQKISQELIEAPIFKYPGIHRFIFLGRLVVQS